MLGSIPNISLCDQAKTSWFFLRNAISASLVVVSKFIPTFTTLVGSSSSSLTSWSSCCYNSSISKAKKTGVIATAARIEKPSSK